ncbi:ABC transporter permease [Arthrobacter sp. H14-L1]|uniref:ABC transporter permease n=1 Tax=Arthrobacter sp. H14-L1 TaxID=2996697 RepID=UPI002271E43A|nr:ABC transporter permease [Arthrobacter sp. H14-L1]MCY0905233.1 ABC transporter permease [Arthrobacter sp. H14-L1]
MDNSTLLNTGPASWVLLALLLALAATVWRAALERRASEVIIAGLRALVQLAVVALLISRLAGHPGLALAFVALMFAVSVWTSGHRVAPTGRWWLAGIPIAAGVLPTAALMFVSSVLPWNALAVIAVLGQQIGGAMASTTLAGRRVEAELITRRGEVEAGVALGFLWSEARSMVAKPVAGEAVLPSIDQTRTSGLVTLPGAFVGLILGGASPLDAGLIQLLVLISLLLVNTSAAWVTMLLSNHGAWRHAAAGR